MIMFETFFAFAGGELIPMNLPRGSWIVWAPKMKGIDCDGACCYNPYDSCKNIKTFYFTDVRSENPEKSCEKMLKDLGLWVDGMQFSQGVNIANVERPWSMTVAHCDEGEEPVVVWRPGMEWDNGTCWS